MNSITTGNTALKKSGALRPNSLICAPQFQIRVGAYAQLLPVSAAVCISIVVEIKAVCTAVTTTTTTTTTTNSCFLTKQTESLSGFVLYLFVYFYPEKIVFFMFKIKMVFYFRFYNSFFKVFYFFYFQNTFKKYYSRCKILLAKYFF